VGTHAGALQWFVSESEFAAQFAEWGRILVVLALPTGDVEYPIFDGPASGPRFVPVNAVSGGVGFARLVAQLLAHEWDLPAVWMLDDNIVHFGRCRYDAGTGASSQKEHKDSPPLEHADDASMATADEEDVPIKRMEDVHVAAAASVSASAPPPPPAAVLAAGGELVVESVSMGEMLWHMEEVQYNAGIRAQAGGWHKYAVLGMARDVAEVLVAAQRRLLFTYPHRVTHCYSAILLNVHAICAGMMPVLLPPRLVWQDIELNALCIDAGLAVVKYARFMHFKRNFTPAVVRRQIEAARAASGLTRYRLSQLLYSSEWAADGRALHARRATDERRIFVSGCGPFLHRSVHHVLLDVLRPVAASQQLEREVGVAAKKRSVLHLLLTSSEASVAAVARLGFYLAQLRGELAHVTVASCEVLLSMPLYFVHAAGAAVQQPVASVDNLLTCVFSNAHLALLPEARQSDCTVYGTCSPSQLGCTQQGRQMMHWIALHLPVSAEAVLLPPAVLASESPRPRSSSSKRSPARFPRSDPPSSSLLSLLSAVKSERPLRFLLLQPHRPLNLDQEPG
jgi:hypothetical protein